MTAAPPPRGRRGLALLAAHCAGLDPDAPSARDRLEKTVGVELARTLALVVSSSGSPGRNPFAA